MKKVTDYSHFLKIPTLLLIFTLVSCQVDQIPTDGVYSRINNITRNPASTDPHKVDNKQIYVYCSIKEHNNLKDCIYKKMRTKDIDFDTLENEIREVHTILIAKQKNMIDDIISKREIFCELNSDDKRQKCLNQYKQTEALSILNDLQSKDYKFNGHEYLLFKKTLEDELSNRYNTIAKKESIKKKLQ